MIQLPIRHDPLTPRELAAAGVLVALAVLHALTGGEWLVELMQQVLER